MLFAFYARDLSWTFDWKRLGIIITVFSFFIETYNSVNFIGFNVIFFFVLLFACSHFVAIIIKLDYGIIIFSFLSVFHPIVFFVEAKRIFKKKKQTKNRSNCGVNARFMFSPILGSYCWFPVFLSFSHIIMRYTIQVSILFSFNLMNTGLFYTNDIVFYGRKTFIIIITRTVAE